MVQSGKDNRPYPQIKIRLIKSKPFFGPGTITILKQIENLGSVREACIKTRISYSKGWSIIKTAEEELGYKIVERCPGGIHGGGAYLTDKGKKWIALFGVYEDKMKETADIVYKEIFFNSDLF